MWGVRTGANHQGHYNNPGERCGGLGPVVAVLV